MRLKLFTLFVGIYLPAVAWAQSLGSTATFTTTINPQYPSPNGQASLSIVSSSLDLTSATMTVSVAGREIYRGNVQPLSISLGNTGSVTAVLVTINSAGANYTKNVFIQPQDVTLISEPVSSAPPLYAGKPLTPLEGDVRVVAMANLRTAKGVVIDPATCSYVWTVDGAQMVQASGIGKDSFLVASPLQYRARAVSVAVSSPDGSLVGGASFSLSPNDPTVRVYENDPLLGIRFDHALSSDYAITEAERTLYAAPFSFSITNGQPLLEWFLNGASAQTGSLITLRPAGSGEGNASLSLVASSAESARATADLFLTFGAAAGGFNFFGL